MYPSSFDVVVSCFILVFVLDRESECCNSNCYKSVSVLVLVLAALFPVPGSAGNITYVEFITMQNEEGKREARGSVATWNPPFLSQRAQSTQHTTHNSRKKRNKQPLISSLHYCQ